MKPKKGLKSPLSLFLLTKICSSSVKHLKIHYIIFQSDACISNFYKMETTQNVQLRILKSQKIQTFEQLEPQDMFHFKIN